MNLEAVDEMAARFPDVDLIFIESGGDNLSATFSPDLADAAIYVIDVAQGEKIPRKGGPGVTRSDLLVINKTDLAPMVGGEFGGDEARLRADEKGKRFSVYQSDAGRQCGCCHCLDQKRMCCLRTFRMITELKLWIKRRAEEEYSGRMLFHQSIENRDAAENKETLHLILMMASPGVLKGILFAYDIWCKENSKVLITEQSYMKLFDMGRELLKKLEYPIGKRRFFVLPPLCGDSFGEAGLTE